MFNSPRKEEGPRRELYCETHDVKVHLSNVDKHEFPCVMRFGVRLWCKTHDKSINAEEIKTAHAKCEVGPYPKKEGGK